MPLFEYECRECKAKFEQLVFGDSSGVVCRKCGSPSVTQLLSVFAVAASGAEPSRSGPSPCETCGAAQRGECMMQ